MGSLWRRKDDIDGNMVVVGDDENDNNDRNDDEKDFCALFIINFHLPLLPLSGASLRGD